MAKNQPFVHTGWRLRDVLRLPWIETNWNGEVRFQYLLCQIGLLLRSWLVGLFLASCNLQFEIPYPLKEFSPLNVIPRIITRARECGQNKPKQRGQVTFLCLRKTVVILSNKLSFEKKKLYSISKEGGKAERTENIIRSTKWFISSYLMPTFALNLSPEWGKMRYL